MENGEEALKVEEDVPPSRGTVPELNQANHTRPQPSRHKVVRSICLCRSVQDNIQATLYKITFEFVNVSGYFRVQSEPAGQANKVLARVLWTSMLLWASLPDGHWVYEVHCWARGDSNISATSPRFCAACTRDLSSLLFIGERFYSVCSSLASHCFVCGRKGHLAAECTQCREPSAQRRQAQVKKK